MPFKLENFHDGNIENTEEFIDKTQYDGFIDFYNKNQSEIKEDVFILFHGGEDPVIFPSAYKNNPKKKRDFGDGFYTTYDVDQANSWAKRKKIESGRGAVSIYEYTNDLDGCYFGEEPTYEWFDFVVQNRSHKCRYKEYDIIEGPVADDDVYTTVNSYMNKEISKEAALNELSYKDQTHQIVFTNEEAILHLNFLGWWDI